MEKFAAGCVEPLISMGAEIVALGLQQAQGYTLMRAAATWRQAGSRPVIVLLK
jgi:hypothetical protein